MQPAATGLRCASECASWEVKGSPPLAEFFYARKASMRRPRIQWSQRLRAGMSRDRQSSSERLIGVEEELLLVDARDGSPRAIVESVIAASHRLTGPIPLPTDRAVLHTHLEREAKQEQIEIVTSPVSTLEGVAGALRTGRSLADAAASEVGARAVALATDPLSATSHISRGSRYEAIQELFRITMQEQLTCGFHIHISVADDAEGVAVIDRIRPWLPLLLALSTNSPLWAGGDSGFASYRTQVWSRWPSAGPTDIFGSPEAYHALVDTLIASGVLLDRGMIYFDARLSEHYPTVEIRVADTCTDLEHAVTIAGLARALVDTAAAEWRSGSAPNPVPTVLLRLAMWSASRFGLTADLLSPTTLRPCAAHSAVEELLTYTSAALHDYGDAERVRHGVESILRHGTGAEYQRRLFAQADANAVVADAAVRTHDMNDRHPTDDLRKYV